MPNLSFETARLKIRPIQPGDEKYIFPAVDQELTKYWIGWEPPKNIEEVKNEIATSIKLSKEKINFDFLAFEKKGNSFAGSAGINPNGYSGEVEINLWVEKSKQGKGFATEMLEAIIEWARQNLEIPFLVYSYTEGNTASKKIIERLNLPLYRQTTAIKRGEKKQVYDFKIPLK